MGNKRFRVRLVRPVFQFVDVEVEAGEEHEALFTAMAGAETIPEDAWHGSFDPDAYGVDAVALDDTAEIDEEIFTSIAESKKYLFLKADTDTGEGEVLYQPWMRDISDLMIADLFSDWSGELAEAGAEGTELFYDQLERHARFLKEGPAKVIPLRRPQGEEE